MRQPTTVEVRLDHGKAVSFGAARPSLCHSGCQRVGCDRISLRRTSIKRTVTHNSFGIRRMSDKTAYPSLLEAFRMFDRIQIRSSVTRRVMFAALSIFAAAYASTSQSQA